tara:strand:+ start:1684 stop:2541 length:858 start_codon:yes stop_codon:yes gene_type:complete
MKKLLLTLVLKRLVIMIGKFGERLKNLASYLDLIDSLSPSTKNILKKNIVFKNKHKNQRAFIIVNGPSLKTQNLDDLKNEITFVVSGFYKHKVIKLWQPTYYSFLDKRFFNGSVASNFFFKELNTIISESTFFVPLFRGYEAIKKQNLLKNQKVHFIATAGTPNSNIELSSVIQSFEGVGAFALAQAIYMGCNPIYLTGFDHDYLANRGLDHHFYEGGTIKEDKLNQVPLLDRSPYDSEMLANYKLWQNYRSLKKIADKKGIKIFNATNGGYLDVFDKVNFDELF